MSTKAARRVHQEHFALVQDESFALPLSAFSSKAGISLDDQLTSIYESYAQLYPNPTLASERLERDRLLEQVRSRIRAEMELQSKRKEQEEPRKKRSGMSGSDGGFFSFFFGSSKGKNVGQDLGGGDLDIREEDHLVFSDIEFPNDSSLCGTGSRIERSCIPSEAHHVARFHLSSCTRQPKNPIVMTSPDEEVGIGPMVILDVGLIAEHVEKEWVVKETSDRSELLNFINDSNSAGEKGENVDDMKQSSYHLSHVRATSVGPNLLAISWGLVDGNVVLYRRFVDTARKKKGAIGWEAYAMLGPTRAILENLQAVGDVFLQNSDGSLSSQALRVTDIRPLLLPEAGLATLAVARLGGYLEVIPIDPAVWQGPPLNAQTYNRPKRKRPRNHATIPHYCVGHLYNIATEEEGRIAVLTTLEHHHDIQSIQTTRTTVGGESKWNRAEFPDTPPAEFILAATGRNEENDQEIISFWSVTTILADHTGDQGIFSLHVGHLGALSTSGSLSRSLFANDAIFRYWRQRRNVELRESIGDSINEPPSKRMRSTATISTPCPIAIMSFSMGRIKDSLYLAVADTQGGIIILNCSLLHRVATHHVSPGDVSEECLVSISLSRTAVAQRIKYRGEIMSIGWLRKDLLLLSTTSGMLKLVSTKTSSGQLLSQFAIDRRAMHFVIRHQKMSLLLIDTELSLLNLTLMDPIDIIQRLTKAQNYATALEVSKGIEAFDEISEIIEECNKKLWEGTNDVSKLGKVLDNNYLFDQVKGLFDKSSSPINISMAREACQVALDRLSKLRLVDAIDLDGEEGIRRRRDEILEVYVNLGTYTILCEHFGTISSTPRYRDSFSQLSLVKLAKSFASKGNLGALSVVLFRHSGELADEVLDVLDAIPLCLDPTSYCHLLPVATGKGMFLSRDNVLHSRNDAPDFFKKELGESLLAAGEDINWLVSRSFCDTESLSLWFESRIERMDSVAGSLQDILRFCDYAMECLGPTENRGIRSSRICAQFLDELILSKVDSTSLLPSISIAEMRSMRANELMELVLQDVMESVELVNRFQYYIQPLLEGAYPANVVHRESGKHENKLSDGMIRDYCLNLSDVISKDGGGGEFEKTRTIKHNLTTIAAVVSASRTTIERERRLIKDKDVLMDLVLQVVERSAKAAESLKMLPSDFRFFVEKYWEMYECLPNQPLTIDESTFHDRTDALYGHLVGVSLVSRWAPIASLSFLTKLRIRIEVETSQAVLVDIVTECCQAFSERHFSSSSEDECLALLQDFVSDLDLLKKACFNSSVDLQTPLKDALVSSLLAHGHVSLLLLLFSVAQPNWIEEEGVRESVRAFMEDALFGDANSGRGGVSVSNKFNVAIRCQDILGSRFPELTETLESMRGYLLAANFIEGNLIHHTGMTLSPMDIREMPPVDVIEFVLRENPLSILNGCAQWADSSYGREANAQLRVQFEGEESSKLPEIPGRALVHLAELLRLKHVVPKLFVLHRMIHHALTSGIPWVAAGLAVEMIQKVKDLSEDVITLCLEAVSEVISWDNYDDLEMRRYLCSQSLLLPALHPSAVQDACLGRITDCLLTFESSRSNFDLLNGTNQSEPGTEGPLPQGQIQGQNLMVFRAAAAVAMIVGTANTKEGARALQQMAPRAIEDIHTSTLKGYSIDVFELFTILRSRAASTEQDDPLLLALSRYFIFWLISGATTPSPSDMEGSLEQDDAIQILGLTASLLGHVHDYRRKSVFVKELVEILEVESNKAMNLLAHQARPSMVRADLGIVRKLVERGFRENGARRATVMTSNESVESALMWAVAHEAEPGFNDPIIILRSPNDVFVDTKMMVALRRLLGVVDNEAEGSVLNASLMAESVKVEREVNTPQTNATRQDENALEIEGEEIKPTGNTQNVGTQELKQLRTQTTTEPTPNPLGNTKDAAERHAFVPALAGIPAFASHLRVADVTNRTNKAQVSKPHPAPQSQPTKLSVKQATRRQRGNDVTLGQRTALNLKDDQSERAALLQKGRLAIQNRKLSRLDDAEKRRLLEKAKTLMTKSRGVDVDRPISAPSHDRIAHQSHDPDLTSTKRAGHGADVLSDGWDSDDFEDLE